MQERWTPRRHMKQWEKTAVNFPDFIEKWTPKTFYKVGYGLVGTVVLTGVFASPMAAVILSFPVAGYWYVGVRDMTQTAHTLRRNFPVLANVRYIFEMIRPEIRQYFIEGDNESTPFSRSRRSMAYQRAKNVMDTQPLGTRRDVYKEGYEWINHSMYPQEVDALITRVLVGGEQCKQPYSASIMNVSGMSYGAISENAILALNGAAKMGNFYQNTGEGGISKHHLKPGGDIVWNVGTGYFGCRDDVGKFSDARFAANASRPEIKMIELKLSQGAKPGHGGILPGAKVNAAIAEARGVPIGEDCISPPRHSAFSGPLGLVDFVSHMRELSGGKPVGVKLCVGNADEVAALVHAMLARGTAPDFITVDGAEGGTGAAPPEFSNSVGTPLVEGVTLVDDLLRGADIRHKVKIICAGKVISGFSIVRNLGLGADICNSARAMMFALGCVQALKCNTNKCPTGITTQDPTLMAGLVVDDKVTRVYNYQRKTVHTALEIVGCTGVKDPADVDRSMIWTRTSGQYSASYDELFPTVALGSLAKGHGSARLQRIWDRGGALFEKTRHL